MTDNAKRIRRERIGVTFTDGTYSEGPWRDASNDPCHVCGKLVIEHSSDQMGACLKQADLEHIRRTGKPIIETVNGVTRQVDADHPSRFWGKNKAE
jgi:hypothetical protein